GYCSTKEDGLISFRWNRRWVVLRENSITFHKSENAPQNSRILLADITNIDRTDLKPYCLLIEMNDRNKLYLCFSNDSQVYGWKDDIYVRTPLIGVGIPSGVSHNSTVGPDPKTGELTRLPETQKRPLQASDYVIAPQDYVQNPRAVLNAHDFYTENQRRELEEAIGVQIPSKVPRTGQQ
ncbi:hypothetical protein M408DRAFT_34621, partial [Serendipita vermifera MAFF 305830]